MPASFDTMHGKWRHYATLRARGHTVTIARTERATFQAGSLYIVDLNGYTLRSLPSWREALAYAANVLTRQTAPGPDACPAS